MRRRKPSRKGCCALVGPRGSLFLFSSRFSVSFSPFSAVPPPSYSLKSCRIYSLAVAVTAATALVTYAARAHPHSPTFPSLSPSSLFVPRVPLRDRDLPQSLVYSNDTHISSP